MPPEKVEVAANRLLAGLPRRALHDLLADAESIAVTFDEVLCQPGEPIRYAYFPTAGFISVAMRLSGGESLEVALVGDEGMLGLSLALGTAASPWYGIAQSGGSALRVSAAAFTHHLEHDAALRRLLNRYLYVLIGQLAQTAACTHFHLVEARLASRLLATRDRAHSDDFHVTHEFLAQVLGVRRVGITNAAGALQERRLISYNRGEVTILDRAGLEAASCGCYAARKSIYERILG